MSNFNRATLAKFLPDHQAIAEFESLNRAVDVVLPNAIEDAGGVAKQAFINAKQALEQLIVVVSRIDSLDLAPLANYSTTAADDLSPTSIVAAPADDLSPRGMFSSQPDDFAPRI